MSPVREPPGRNCLKLCREEVPEFAEIVSVFGSPQIRHVGTIGGNIINASPIADSLPFLFVMEAELELAGPQRSPPGEHQRFLSRLQEIRSASR